MSPTRIFISSVQQELAAERRAVKDFVHNDALLRLHYEVFLIEDLPARDQRADQVYLEEVDRCELFIGLLGMQYGQADSKGVSPTEREFDRATVQGKERLIYVMGATDQGRDPRMAALLRKAGGQLVRKRVGSAPELTAAVYASLVEHLQRTGVIRTKPLDAAACPDATLDDLDPAKVERFLRSAQRERNFVLGPGTPVRDVLTHLNLLDGEQPSHAAVLLFAKAPQRFYGLISSEVKCMEYPTASGGKPMLDYRIFKGTVFELVDQALHFVMGKLAHAVGTRSEGAAAPVTPEIPREVVAEAIVNAVAHRDYASAASVQVELFPDRLEVSNPGSFPAALRGVDLSKAHTSLPHNPLIADPFFLAHYIEKAGTGLMDMFARCRAAGLDDPQVGPVPGRGVVQMVKRAVVQPESQPESQPELQPESLADRVLAVLLDGPRSKAMIANAVGHKRVSGQLNLVVRDLLRSAAIELTLPDRPNSRLQQYRITEQGRIHLRSTTST